MSLKQFIKERQKSDIKIDYKKEDIIQINDKIIDHEYEYDVPQADRCMIPYLEDVFSWKRGFQNCFTGYPNDGKTIFTLFIMLIKSLKSNWKWVIWSPEMRSSTFIDGKVFVHYNDLIRELSAMMTGKTPYKHISNKYKVEMLTREDLFTCVEFIKKHFIFLDPTNRSPDYVYNLLLELYANEGFDGVLIDPFKNLEHDMKLRDDIYLDRLFDRFKDMAVRTNSVMNWIAHPKANVQRIRKVNKVEVLMPCDQYMLNGGSAWDNNMDGIYSVFRFDLLNNIKSPKVNFLNLKQRKQELTTERGVCTGIEFNIKKRRFFFKGIDVLN